MYSDIIIGSAVLYRAAVGTALPDPNTVGYGADWGGDWTKFGLTNAPITANHEKETYDVMVEQSTLPVKRAVTDENFRIETALVEITASNLQSFMGGTVTTTPAGASQVGMEELVTGGEVQLQESTWAIEGLYQNDAGEQFPVRIQIYRATAVINGDLEFSKAKEVGIPLQINALADLSKSVGQQLILFQKITAAATA